MLGLKKFSRGDTIIEVLFAVTVFSLIAVSALSLMNQGSATSQRALEITLVSQEVDNQAEVLRYLHEAYVKNYETGYASTTALDVAGPAGEFYDIVQLIRSAGSPSEASPFGGGSTCPTPPTGSFVLNTRNATVRSGTGTFSAAQTYAKLDFSGPSPVSRGVWIEGIRSDVTPDPVTSNSGYIDFHIRACWSAPGLSLPSTFGTIVRLYEPRG